MTHPAYAEAKDVTFTTLQASQPARDGTVTLSVAGFVMHSALGVKGVQVDRVEGRPRILVALTPVGFGHTGNFSATVELDGGRAEVLFGPATVRVWPPADRAGGS